MAVQVLQDWVTTPFASGTADPAGTLTVPTGTNRTLIYVQYGRQTGASTTASVAVGGIAATGYQKEDWNYNSATGFVGVYTWYWDETAVAQISAAGSSDISYSDTEVNWRDRGSTYATFGSVDQTTPISIVASRLSTVASASPMTLTYNGSAGDHVAVVQGGVGTARVPQLGDATLAQRINVLTSTGAWALYDGAWASTETALRHDDAELAGTFIGAAVKVNQFVDPGVNGSGSIDGLVPTVAAVGERTITAAGSLDGYIATVAGGGLVNGLIAGAGSISAQVATVAGVGSFDTTISGFFPRIVREVTLYDGFFGFKVTLQENPTTNSALLQDVAGKGVYMDDHYHCGVNLTDSIHGRYTQMTDTVYKSVLVQNG